MAREWPMRVSYEDNLGVHWTTVAVDKNGDCDALQLGDGMGGAFTVWPIRDADWPGSDGLCEKCREELAKDEA
jgi:hypothetical protein